MKSLPVLGTVLLAASLHPVLAANVPVRFAEGVTHGFLVLRSLDGAILAHGDLLQAARGDEIAKQMIFRFKDGSTFDERTSFTQNGIYALKTYTLSERGPAFDADTELSLTAATGAYRVTVKDHKGGKEKTLEGVLELPPDVYNGLIMTIVKDLPKGTGETVHLVAFTPEPRIIQLAMSPLDEQKVTVGDLTKNAVRIVMKPKLGMWLKFFATILGRIPPDVHAWILTDDVPAFVGYEGTLGTQDSIWRIEVVSPRRSE